MAGFLLASAADNIVLWDCTRFNVVQQFDPFKQNLSGIAWRRCNTRLLSTCDTFPQICHSAIESSAVTSSWFGTPLLTNEGHKCISWNTSGRYTISGGTDSIVYIHDLKTQKLRRSYKVHTSPVTCALFNHNDTYTTTADNSGHIIVRNILSGQSSRPLVAPKVEAVNQIDYNPFHKAWLASVSNDGSLHIWDTNTRHIYRSYPTAHAAPAMGLVWSPINSTFLVSVGLDKCVHFFDVSKKVAMNSIRVTEPLTSVDMFSDGHTLALGSVRGTILIYDLRQAGIEPLHTLTQHHTSVKCLKFQRSPPQSSVVSDTSSDTSSLSLPVLTHEVDDSVSQSTSVQYEQVLSPLKSEVMDAKMEQTNNSISTMNFATDQAGLGVISPLANTSNTFDVPQLGSFMLSTHTFSTNDASVEMSGHRVSPLVTDCHVSQTGKGSMTSKALTKELTAQADTSHESRALLNTAIHSLAPAADKHCLTDHERKRSEEERRLSPCFVSSPDSFSTAINTFAAPTSSDFGQGDHHGNRSCEIPAPTIDDSQLEDGGRTDMEQCGIQVEATKQSEQTDFSTLSLRMIRSIVEEEINDLRFDLARGQGNMFMSIYRLFSSMRQEINQHVDVKISVLLDEVAQLRMENEQLRRTILTKPFL